MQQDRMTSEGSPPPSRRAESAADDLVAAASSTGDQGTSDAQTTSVGRAAWETTRAAAAQAAAGARDVVEESYDAVRGTTRVADVALLTLLAGAAVGYAAAYFIHSSGKPDHLRRATRVPSV